MTSSDIAAQLPDIPELRRRCQVIASLDEQLSGGRFGSYFYVPESPAGPEKAWMRNGGGDEWDIHFTEAGVFIRVFDHESEMTPYGDDDLELWPGLIDGLPSEFHSQMDDFRDEGQFIATAVIWRLTENDRWHIGAGIEFPPSRGPYDTNDGSAMLEPLLDATTANFMTWATENYGPELVARATETDRKHQP